MPEEVLLVRDAGVTVDALGVLRAIDGTVVLPARRLRAVRRGIGRPAEALAELRGIFVRRFGRLAQRRSRWLGRGGDCFLCDVNVHDVPRCRVYAWLITCLRPWRTTG